MKLYLSLFIAWRFSLVALNVFLSYLNRKDPLMFLTVFGALYLTFETLWILKKQRADVYRH